MFCGECGSSTSATAESRRRADPRPGDTTVLERGLVRESGVVSIPVEGFHAPVESAAADAGADAGVHAGEASVAEASVTETLAGAPAVDAPVARAPEAGAPPATAGGIDAADAEAGATEAAEPAALPWAPDSQGEPDAATPPARALARFILRFSTGETRTVFGTGLIGRRPIPQPGETFDHLVQIADRSLSVSKTHLEFGEHDEELWVADRFSANGTVVHRPDDGAVRCEPGRRYLVPRGSRVEIAEQSFRVE
jgi:hypothetical protein